MNVKQSPLCFKRSGWFEVVSLSHPFSVSTQVTKGTNHTASAGFLCARRAECPSGASPRPKAGAEQRAGALGGGREVSGPPTCWALWSRSHWGLKLQHMKLLGKQFSLEPIKVLDMVYKVLPGLAFCLFSSPACSALLLSLCISQFLKHTGFFPLWDLSTCCFFCLKYPFTTLPHP